MNKKHIWPQIQQCGTLEAHSFGEMLKAFLNMFCNYSNIIIIIIIIVS